MDSKSDFRKTLVITFWKEIELNCFKVKSEMSILLGGQQGVTTALLAEPEVKRPCTLGLSVAKPQEFTNNTGVVQILKRKNSLSRQRSLEQFTEVSVLYSIN